MVANHQSTELDSIIFSQVLTYQEYNCGERPLQSDMDHQENDTAFHLCYVLVEIVDRPVQQHTDAN